MSAALDAETRDRLIAALPRLRRFCRGLVGRADEADDLAQAVCERALRHIGQWHRDTAMEPWLFRIARTVWIDRLRALRVRLVHANETRHSGMRAETDGGEAHAVDRLSLAEVDRAMRALPPEQREVIVLVTIEQFSYAEAAALLEVPVGTIMSRLSRGRMALRRLAGVAAAGEPPAPDTAGNAGCAP